MTQRFIVTFDSLKTEITRSSAVPIEDFIITMFCLIDDECKKIASTHRLRTRDLWHLTNRKGEKYWRILLE